MTVAVFDSLTRHATAHSITFYQRYLSPHKGFACAHRVLHRGESCSQYVKQVVMAQRWGAGLPLIRDRFQACKAAKLELQHRQTLRMAQKHSDSAQKRKEEQNSSSFDCADWDLSGCDLGGCEPSECVAVGDGAACTECSGLDCGSFEVCSCDGGDCAVGSCDFG